MSLQDDRIYVPFNQRFDQPVLESQMLAPVRKVVGESAHSAACNALQQADVMNLPLADAVDAVIQAIMEADLTNKKGIGRGKHGLGEKRAQQLRADLMRIMQGRGR